MPKTNNKLKISNPKVFIFIVVSYYIGYTIVNALLMFTTGLSGPEWVVKGFHALEAFLHGGI
ncbi:MAG TPA: hypothetical protein GX741_03635 [Erysipelothrix sp.]|nr:hypothetical protein [Erysipelothrix sp.]